MRQRFDGLYMKQAGAEALFQDAMRGVYLWMTLGMMVTAATAFGVAASGLWRVVANPFVYFTLVIGELILVVWLSRRVHRMPTMQALFMFLLYAWLNGLTLSLIFLAYSLGSIALAFFAAGCLFGAMTIVGYTTGMDLSRMGSFLVMGLIGLMIAMVVNIFLASSGLDWLITLVGIAIFIGLTAWDTQKIKRLAGSAAYSAGGDTGGLSGRLAIIGALTLYLDFLNLFLFLLRLMGRRE